MCSSVWIGDRHIQRYGELCEAIAPTRPVLSRPEDYGAMEARDCLCPINFEATAQAAGYVCEWDSTWGEHRFVPASSLPERTTR